MRNICTAGLDLIKNFEGLRLNPYQDSDGIWSIGYGHTAGVSAASVPISLQQAEVYLRADLADAESEVLRLISVALNDNQYGALVSLVYNAGNEPLHKTLGNLLNAGNYASAADEFSKWVYANGEVSSGLVRRRAVEKELFLTPVFAR